MPRKPRIEKAGFYHIVNRGVAKTNIYLCNDDFLKFLEILQERAPTYYGTRRIKKRQKRLHSALDYQTPDEVFYKGINNKCYNAKKALLEVA